MQVIIRQTSSYQGEVMRGISRRTSSYRGGVMRGFSRQTSSYQGGVCGGSAVKPQVTKEESCWRSAAGLKLPRRCHAGDQLPNIK